MEIKIKDVKDFLEVNGYNWEEVLRVNNSRTMHFVRKLQFLQDLIMLVNAPIIIQKGAEAKDRDLSIEVRLLDFVVNTRSTDGTFTFKQNLKKEWIKFLTKRYGKDYINELNHIVKSRNNNSNYSLIQPRQEVGLSY